MTPLKREGGGGRVRRLSSSTAERGIFGLYQFLRYVFYFLPVPQLRGKRVDFFERTDLRESDSSELYRPFRVCPTWSAALSSPISL